MIMAFHIIVCFILVKAEAQEKLLNATIAELLMLKNDAKEKDGDLI